MFNKLTLKDYDLTGKRVLLRVDFNVPMNEAGNITSDKRMIEALPTIEYLKEQGAKIIICSHLGRPEGKPDPKFSLKPVVEHLKQLLKAPVFFSGEIVGPETRKIIRNMENGDIIVLENLRFDPGEEENNPIFCKKLASIADIYCNDAFGTMHRAHASTVGVAKLLPNCIGFLVEKEVQMFDLLLSNPKRPFVVVLGGKKIKDKINLISNLINIADTILIGGAMAYTFLEAKGFNMGHSIVEKDKIPLAKLLLDKAEKRGTKILLPIDHVVVKEFNFIAESRDVDTKDFADDDIGMDIGPRTTKLFSDEISKAKTVFWNGPMGVFEFSKFERGTKNIAEAVVASKAVSVVGGGDSASALAKIQMANMVTHLSTGGGAALEFMEGKGLPGLDAISDKVE